jgi:hypothetical protein
MKIRPILADLAPIAASGIVGLVSAETVRGEVLGAVPSQKVRRAGFPSSGMRITFKLFVIADACSTLPKRYGAFYPCFGN